MNELHKYLVDEVIEDYSDGSLSRRDALKMLGSLVGSATALQLLNGCTVAAKAPAPAAATPAPSTPRPGALSVPANDPTIVAEKIEFTSGGDKIMGYLARPVQGGKRPIVLVCQENRGLTPHIEDVTRRLAKAGYCAVAVDLLSREGGTAKHKFEDIPGLLGKVPPARHVQDFAAALAFAKAKPFARATDPGMVGFCFGGGVTWRVAASMPELKAAVPYYGPVASNEDIPKIKAAVLAIYAENDARINAGIAAAEEAMKKNGKTFEKIVYPGVEHAFNNDTGNRYNEKAAMQAWEKTLAWFEKYLKPAAM